MARIAVTGGTGFVGKALLGRLIADGHEVVSLQRTTSSNPDLEAPVEGLRRRALGDDWTVDKLAPYLIGVDTLVHLASRNHHVGDDAAKTAHLYKQDIFELTKNLAAAATSAGVRHLIYLSTIKAREIEQAPDLESQRAVSPYGYYKLMSEKHLLAQPGKGPQISIIRPPLVYDLEAKGNFATMIKLVNTGLPIPLFAKTAKRALISRDNLVDCLAHLVTNSQRQKTQPGPGAMPEPMEVFDGVHYDLKEQFTGIASALDRPARIIPVPKPMLKLAMLALGKRSLYETATSPLPMSNADLTSRSGWEPRHAWLGNPNERIKPL